MLSHPDIVALWVTLKLAGISTLILMVIGTPLAWWLSRTSWSGKPFLEAIIALPLVLPPTVLGFYMLLTLGPHGPIGGLIQFFGGHSLAFTFTGLVFGSVVYSLPFVVNPLRDAFVSVGQEYLDTAASLRASPIDCFFTVVVPLARPGFLTAAVLGFAHTVGEFGVVLMIGGNIPGRTQVMSIAIYDHVENLEYTQAHWIAGGLVLLSFVLLFTIYSINRRTRVIGP